MLTVKQIVDHFVSIQETDEICGVWPDIPEEAYNNALFPGIRSSQIKAVLKQKNGAAAFEPSKYLNKTSDALSLGKAFAGILEGKSIKDVTKNLGPSDVVKLNSMKNCYFNNKILAPHLVNIKREVTYIARCPKTKLLLRIRVDGISDNGILVLMDDKTCHSSDKGAFIGQCWSFGYFMALGMYDYVHGLVTAREIEQHRLNQIPTEFPYTTTSYLISPFKIAEGKSQMFQGLGMIKAYLNKEIYSQEEEEVL